MYRNNLTLRHLWMNERNACWGQTTRVTAVGKFHRRPFDKVLLYFVPREKVGLAPYQAYWQRQARRYENILVTAAISARITGRAICVNAFTKRVCAWYGG